ncbi:Protein of unknown function (DUF2905) [Orenia metallireducens]|jgi:hypothetical protein|uniref:DUF2905 domain-containing protein n=1 Tax=Orenia metallireducens TaxID=1413210 RepID=A0A285G989_9FIRM|nr:DUF2905 domain-containing protein [Orenia metallireducens]PRX28299.1 Protein of unknown function (DUF2905) [Orenia metallireducens]SNY19096.1 Protein of unknown function [Orenia metallireducens]
MKDLFGGQIILIGILLIVIGIIIKLGFPLGRLPGDIYIKKENFSFYFPLTTGILVSLILSLILRLFR